MMKSPRLCWADDPMCEDHLPPPGYLEGPERLRAVRRGLARAGITETGFRLEVFPASFEELSRVHTPTYLEHLANTQGRSGFLDVDTFYSEGSFRAAVQAAGAAVAMTNRLLRGESDHGIALTRPPGQHAGASAGKGSCLINHVAVAASHALAQGARRVLILDWDVHHGNGTAEIFAADPRVLYVSLHRKGQFPGTGDAANGGRDDGSGYTVNIPLSAGADDLVYGAAFRRIVLPIVEQYGPELSLVSAGYGAHHRDPFGGMRLGTSAFAWMTWQLCETLRRGPSQHLGFVLEGGYDLEALEACTHATLGALFREPVGIDATKLEERHSRELDTVCSIQRRFWKLS
jgi:acetoin utilization deacetylase AcuC-like enzyme